jgi:hypothetical protein
MRSAAALTLVLVLSACGSEVVFQASPQPDDPPTVPADPPDDPPDDPPVDPPRRPDDPPVGCELSVTVESIAGNVACGYGGVSNISPGTLLAVEAAPDVAGLRLEMQGCPDGADCTCAITVACVGADIADFYANTPPTLVQAWIQPTEIIIGKPGPWECIDCGYGPPFFHAASQLAAVAAGGTISVEAGQLTSSETIDGATFETRALDAAAYEIAGLAPVQILLGSASVEQGETLALAMDDDLLTLSVRNLRSTWCTEDCGPNDPVVGSADWVIFGPIL